MIPTNEEALISLIRECPPTHYISLEPGYAVIEVFQLSSDRHPLLLSADEKRSSWKGSIAIIRLHPQVGWANGLDEKVAMSYRKKSS